MLVNHLKNILIRFYAIDMSKSLNNKDLIAKASFGTQFGVCLVILIMVLLFQSEPTDPRGYIVLFMSMMGSSFGYWLWKRGYKMLSISLSTGGLLVGGIFCHLVLHTIGGPTGILLLASVITAGGLGGKREAAITSSIVVIWLLFGYVYIPKDFVAVPELIYLAFVGSSVPCWGAYVVALDIYNQDARKKTEDSLDELQVAHETLRRQQSELERAHMLQNRVIEIGRLAMSVDKTEKVLEHCFASLAGDEHLLVGLVRKGNTTLLEHCRKIERVVELEPTCWPANGQQEIHSVEELDPALRHFVQEERGIQVVSVPIYSTQFNGSVIAMSNSTEPLSSNYINFLREIAQILQIRYMREDALEERARLAARIQQEERLDSLVRMAGEIAHDFNNTLMVISGTADIFENHKRFPVELQRPLTRMQNATQISAELTNKLLTFCRGVSSPRVLIDPYVAIENFIPILEFTVSDKIELTFEKVRNSKRYIKTTSGQIEQILLNLITNAKDAIREGGQIHIVLSHVKSVEGGFCATTPEWATHLQIVVKDNGIGMSQEELNRAFEPFFSKKEAHRGGGLGLAIVHGIIAQTKGVLDISSELNGGTTVTIALPFHTEAPKIPSQEKRGGSEMVLLVDDEPDVRYAVAMQLDMLGYEVQQAGSIAEAMDILQKEHPLLLLSDIRLKNESGYTLVKEARAYYPQLPVLYITGFSGFSDDQPDNEEVLLKPFSSTQLDEKIRQVLPQKRLLRSQ
ncbi:MAG: ATP-binding protein [Myxococcota bacterium]|nr:ATP-binding protein [Myxococcota bacterium]